MRQNFLYSQDSQSEILTIAKGNNWFGNLLKLMCNNLNLYLVNIKANAKLGQILSICSQNIEWKQKFDNNQGP